MIHIQVDHIWKSFGERVVLQDISFQINEGERVGLVGRNGEGKTTLFRILLGEEEADRGSWYIQSPWGYLAQIAQDYAGTVQEYFQEMGALDYQIKRAMGRVGLDEAFLSAHMRNVSGGERTRVRLARVLLSDPSVLLLDEPTNHLDIQALQWLEDFIKRFSGTVLVISHDRYFLDRVVGRILELEQGQLREYTGNYSEYARRKKELLEKQYREYEEYMNEKRRLEDAVRKRMQKGQSMERVRRPRDSFQARNSSDFYKAKARKVSQNAKALEKRLEKLEKKEKPRESRNIHLNLEADNSNISRILAEGAGLEKGYGSRKLFSGANFQIRRGSRIALLGDNGVGKTTLIRILLGQEKADKGSLRIAPSVRIGYLDQELNQLREERTVLEEAAGEGSGSQEEIRTLLGCLLFRKDDVYKPIGVLSMGERVRLSLARLILAGCNLLVMDEPTNHLDLPSREAVEEALLQYNGTLLFVSHDRYFLERMATETWVIEEGRLRCLPYSYTEFIRHQTKAKQQKKEEDLLVLETRLSRLSAELDSCTDEEERAKLNREFVELAREINRRKGALAP
ncbi:MAG: ribosomal protection-like ABC-F family protein [Clostridia bacterium]|jgi:ATPase subunit of ABC transporter with duplicated ATPase domains